MDGGCDGLVRHPSAVYIHSDVSDYQSLESRFVERLLFACRSQDHNQIAMAFFHANLFIPGCNSMGVGNPRHFRI
jgi:hypothetical protein